MEKTLEIQIRHYMAKSDYYEEENINLKKRISELENEVMLSGSATIELLAEKTKKEELIKFLEDNIECCKINEINKDSTDPVDTATYSMYVAFNNVLDFIKNLK